MTTARNAPLILVIDPALSRRSGHHFNAARRLQRAAHEIGGRIEVLCSGFADAGMVDELGARPVFQENVYLRQEFNRQEFDRQTAQILDDFIVSLSPIRFAPDVIALPTCDQVLARALASYLRFARPGRMPDIAAWIVLPPELMASGDQNVQHIIEGQVSEIREGFGDLAAVLGAGGQLKLFCETPKLAEYYGAASGLPMEIMPCPSVTSLLSPVEVAADAGRSLKFISIGHLNRGKGYELLPVAIDRAIASGADARFFIHAACPAENLAKRRLIDMIRAVSPSVETETGDLSEDAYTSLLRSADLVILPYDPAIYGARGSGVFSEAESLGIPTIVTSGCSFAEAAIASGRCVKADAYTVDAVASAIVTAVRSIHELRFRTRKHAQRGREVRESSDVEALLAGLLAHRATRTIARDSGWLGQVLAEARHLSASADRTVRSRLGPKTWQRRARRLRNLFAPPSAKGPAPLQTAWTGDLFGDSAWDVAAPRPPRCRYIIAAMHRSGSNLMVRQLFRAGAGLPAEYFHPKLPGPLLARWGFESPNSKAYAARLFACRQAADGTWGAKLHWEHVESLGPPVVNDLFAGSKIIFTRRRDLAMQTLSYARALLTGRWDPRWEAGDERQEHLDPGDLRQLAEIAAGLVSTERQWADLFTRLGLKVHEVWYEDYLADQDGTHGKIFDFLGIQRTVPPIEMAPAGKTGDAVEDQRIVAGLSERIASINLARPIVSRQSPCD